VESSKLIITHSLIPAAEQVNMAILVAVYNADGQLTDCQMVETVTGITQIDLTATGELQVFFLNPCTNAPLLVNAEL
jgi:hypothetical protein